MFEWAQILLVGGSVDFVGLGKKVLRVYKIVVEIGKKVLKFEKKK